MSSTDRAALLDAARAKGAAEIAHWEQIYRPTPIIAPMAGLVIARSVEPGQTIGTTDQVFVMSDHLLVVAQVDETDMAKVALGQDADITLDAYRNQKVPGTVHQIAFEAKTVNNVTMYDVQITPKEVPPFMRSGMTVSVDFKVAERKDVLVLPAAVVHQEDGQATVLVPNHPEGGERGGELASADGGEQGGDDGGDHARRRGLFARLLSSGWHRGDAPRTRSVPVETGLTDGRSVEIVSGLREGDVVLEELLTLPDAKAGGINPFAPGRTRGAGGGRNGGAGGNGRSGGGARGGGS
jgi:macrolide-specific efflux system membrane fusion protein